MSGKHKPGGRRSPVNNLGRHANKGGKANSVTNKSPENTTSAASAPRSGAAGASQTCHVCGKAGRRLPYTPQPDWHYFALGQGRSRAREPRVCDECYTRLSFPWACYPNDEPSYTSLTTHFNSHERLARILQKRRGVR